MDDVFARIGLALKALTSQSTIYGTAREEVERLSAELEAFEGGIQGVIDARVSAGLEGIEGRLHAYVDQNFQNLAASLEALNVNFTPIPPPLAPPIVSAAPEPAPEEAPAEPAPTTGNIPAPPDPNAGPAEPAAPVEPATESTSGNLPHVPEPEPEPEAPPASDADAAQAPAEPEPAPEPAVVANDTIDAGAQSDSGLDSGSSASSEAGSEAETPVGGAGEDLIDPDPANVTGEQTDPAPAEGDGTLTMVEGGGSDVIP